MNEDEKRKRWSTSTDSSLYNQIKQLSEETRIPLTKLLDEAIEDLLLKHNVIQEKTKTP